MGWIKRLFSGKATPKAYTAIVHPDREQDVRDTIAFANESNPLPDAPAHWKRKGRRQLKRELELLHKPEGGPFPTAEALNAQFQHQAERNDCLPTRARNVWVIQAIEPIRTHSRNPGVGYWRGTRQRELSSKVDLAVQFVRRRDAARVLEALTDDNPEIREHYRVARVLVADEGSQ